MEGKMEDRIDFSRVVTYSTLNSNDATNIDYLYQSLARRKSYVNISHRVMPSYSEHFFYVLNNKGKYILWQIIQYDLHKVGHFYVTELNEVGIHIDEEWQGKGFGEYALNKIIEFANSYKIKTLYANISTYNEKSKDFFGYNGFTPFQITYEFKLSSEAS